MNQPLDPKFFEAPEMRAALHDRDVGTVYRLLGRQGVSQRQIAKLTGQSQSEVSEIIKGRQVVNILVLERIADGLGVPRAWMGVSFDEEKPSTPRIEEVDGSVKRRTLRTATSTAALGLEFLGQKFRGQEFRDLELMGLEELPTPSDFPLPTRLEMRQVRTVVAVTEQLRGLTRYFGGQADVLGTLAAVYLRWMQVPGTDEVKAKLAAALSEMHTEAGWACYDAGVDGYGYFTRAMGLAGEYRDSYGIANASWHGGMTMLRTGHPNDALTMFQLGRYQLRGEDPRLPTLAARLARSCAGAYALLDCPDEAIKYLAEANDGRLAEAKDGGEPRDAFERAGADLGTAVVHRDLGQLEAAERFATSAVHAYGEGKYRRGRTVAGILLAEVTVRAGQPRGVSLARDAIEAVRTLLSVAARRDWLLPLARALEARPGAEELARTAREVAETRI
ncbi:MAG: helix-turn-helix domain-containing protein [Pseudonocardiaceae bacterium]